MMSQRATPIAVLILGLAPVWAKAQPPQPPPPKEYDVQFRYRIQAGRNDRLRQFFEFVKYLDTTGFQKDPGPFDEPENSRYDRMSGKIASERVAELLRAPQVKTLLLFPAGYKLPADPEQPVKLRLQISAGRPLEEQRILADQVRQQLRTLGFREPFLYDHRQFTRLVGFLPAGSVSKLLVDLRYQPSGWLTAERPLRELPLPLRDINAVIRVAEVTPEPDGVEAVKELPPSEPINLKDPLVKVAPDLRALIGKEDKPRRIELTLLRPQGPDEPRWQGELRRASPNAVIEGRFGQIVTVLATPEQAAALAAAPSVLAVRLPRSGVSLLPPPGRARDVNAVVLEMSGLTRLHGQGFRGQGVRVAIIGADFRGFEALRGKQLPKGTKLIDLTAERDTYLKPEPTAEGAGPGHGTLCAVAVALAAPDAELVLVRVDPTAYHQMQTIARNINGETFLSESMLTRRDEFESERKELTSEWHFLLRQRRYLFDNIGSEDELGDEARKRAEQRKAHREELAKLEKREALYHDSMERYLKLLADLRGLQEAQVVVSTLAWPDGHPVDGSSALSRYLDDRPFRSTWWFQSAGDFRGQTWTGLFRDSNNDGVMEFAPLDRALRPERWTPEVNFLAYQAYGGPRVLELPVGKKLRITVQWREAHDPSFVRRGEDGFLQPLSEVRLLLLRQRDPSGKQVPADEMEFVARSVGLPLRINNQEDCATYEQVLEFTVDKAGRYAVRMEGQAPRGNKPAGVAVLPLELRTGELRPRLFLDGTDADGRCVFLDYATNQGDIAVPGDAQRVVTVGAADRYNLARPYSSAGPALDLALQTKPILLSYDGLGLEAGQAIHGTNVAASFAGGLAASLLSNGAPSLSLRGALPVQGESIFFVPERWQGYRPTPRR